MLSLVPAAVASRAPQGFPHRQSPGSLVLLGLPLPRKRSLEVVGGPSQEPRGGKTQRHAQAHPKKSFLTVTVTRQKGAFAQRTREPVRALAARRARFSSSVPLRGEAATRLGCAENPGVRPRKPESPKSYLEMPL